MKKYFLALLIISNLFFIGCSGDQGNTNNQEQVQVDTTVVAEVEAPAVEKDPLKLKLSELKSACDYIDAAQQLIIAANEEKGDSEVSDLDSKQLKKVTKIINKIVNVIDAAEKKYTEVELKECKNFDDVVGKAHRFEEEWGDQLGNYHEDESGDMEL